MVAIGRRRLEYVDVAKGLAIIGVYFGHHAVLPNCMINWFWAFHMPLFFIITGMYFKLSIFNDSFHCGSNSFY